jgi:hypothetical protein
MLCLVSGRASCDELPIRHDISLYVGWQVWVCSGRWSGSTGVMNDEDSNLTLARGDTGTGAAIQDPPAGRPRLRLWVNWILALLTIPAAAAVLLFAIGAMFSTDVCSDKQCPNLGLRGVSFDVLFWGAPAVALVAIAAAFVTARRRWGIVVPLCALALLGADIAILSATVLQ